jgi:hypothetical protein
VHEVITWLMSVLLPKSSTDNKSAETRVPRFSIGHSSGLHDPERAAGPNMHRRVNNGAEEDLLVDT